MESRANAFRLAGLVTLLVPLEAPSLAGPWLPAAGGPLAAPKEGQATGPKRRSLEDILREVQAERARAATSLQPRVKELVAEIDKLRASRRGLLSREKANELVALGPSALALLIPYLEPGKRVSRQTVFRAELISDLLRTHPSATTTDPLLATAVGGSLQARLGALRALEATREPRRVAPALIELASGEHTEGLKREAIDAVSRAAFSTLAALDDDRAQGFIGDALKSDDKLLCSGALSALVNATAESSSTQILALLESLEDPRPVAGSIADYYGHHEDLLDDPEHARALASIAVHEATPNEPRVRMFDTLRVSDAKIGSTLKRDVAPYLDASRPDVRMAARMLLARLKDRGARQSLLKEFDDRIKRDKTSIDAHSDRATILHAIGDWNASVRSWRVVLTQMASDELSRARKEPFIGIARSLARLRKFREAASYLSQGPLSVDELRKLGEDRDFKEMRDTRYGEVFQSGD